MAKVDAAVAVIGSGGVGCMLAAALVEAGRNVVMCVRTPFDRLEIVSGGETREVPVRIATDPAEVGPVRWILLTTKAQDTGSAKGWVEALSGPDTVLVMLQNGLDAEGRGRAVAGGARVLPAVVYCAVERDRPGHVIHHTASRLVVPAGPDGAAFADLLAGTIFEVVQTPDFHTAVWRKLCANLTSNPVTALTLRRHAVMREPAVRDLAGRILAEAVAVATADGAALTLDEMDRMVSGFGAGGSGGTSMLYDRIAGRTLEYEAITGALVEAAGRHGIPVPVNETLLALLQGASGHPLDGSG